MSTIDLSKLDWSTFIIDDLDLSKIDLSTLDLSSLGLDLTKIPLVAPPKGVQPNFDNPSSSLAPAIIAVSATMVILTFSLVVMRLYSNHHSARKFGFDDCKSHHRPSGRTTRLMKCAGTCIVATILLMAVVAMDVDCKQISPFMPSLIIQPSYAACTVRQYARHDYDIPISWLTPAYIKVNATSTKPGTVLLTIYPTETLCYRYSRWTEHLFR